MHIKPVKTKRDYREALKEIESLMAAKIDTPEGDRLDISRIIRDAHDTSYRAQAGRIRNR